jgi:hypothetical protein
VRASDFEALPQRQRDRIQAVAEVLARRAPLAVPFYDTALEILEAADAAET